MKPGFTGLYNLFLIHAEIVGASSQASHANVGSAALPMTVRSVATGISRMI